MAKMTKEEILELARKAYEKANKRPAFSLPVVVRPDDKNTKSKEKAKMTKEELIALSRKAYEEANKKPFWSLPFIVRPDEEKKASATEAYERGFRKCAEANGVDPSVLARFILSKEAETDVWGKLRTWLDQAKEWYGKQDAGTKALINAGGGALVGGTLGGIFGGGKGLAAGALLGGLGGASVNPLVEVYNKANGPKLTSEQLEAIRRAGYDSVKR